jgi:hypothetical protein
MEVSGQLDTLPSLLQAEGLDTHWIIGLMGSRVGLDAEEKR